MRRTLILLFAMMMVMALAPVALAGEGGKPGAHGLHGSEWGKAVSDLATSAPGAVAGHIKEQKDGAEVSIELDESDPDEPKGKAYGWRIKNAFGMSYGELLNDYKSNFEDSEYVGPHGETEPLPVVGAKAFWLVHELLL
jgi:hypothetical protein